MTTDERLARLARTVMELVELLDGGPLGTGPRFGDDTKTRMALLQLRSELAEIARQ